MLVVDERANRTVLLLDEKPALTTLSTRRSTTSPARMKVALLVEPQDGVFAAVAEFRLEMN